MIGIDTNVLVRYFTEDDNIQSQIASKLIERHSNKKKAILINNIVLCELVWVLLRGYKYKKSDVINLLKEIIATIEFAFEDHSLIVSAILEYEEAETDFADILIGFTNRSKGADKTITFDKDASKLDQFEYIGE